MKNLDIFLIFVQNIECGYTLEPPHRGSSNEHPQCMFWIKNKNIRYTPVNPSFYIGVCDIGVQISVRPSVRSFVRPSTFTSKFGFLDINDSCESQTVHSNCP